MEHFRSLSEAHLTRPSVVTIGVFDGVHRGHQYLIRKLVEEAHTSNRNSVVITFYPHPDVVLRGITGRYYLTTPEERASLFGALGVDYVITLTFDDVLRQIRAADFTDQMLSSLNLDSLWVGSDFAMGFKREGNVEFLQAQGASKGFSVHVIDMLLDEGGKISSTTIRQALEKGEVDAAKEQLGRSYSVTGEVVHGQKRGRTIGFPTANIEVDDSLIIPANGVYAGWATWEDQRYKAVTNVGIRPTFEGQAQTVEAYLLDFSGDLYGKYLTFTFEDYLRPEMKFDGIQSLIAQIQADVERGREVLSEPR